MLFEFDYLFDKILSEIFRESSVAISLRKSYDAYSRQILKTFGQFTILRKNNMLYNEKYTNPLISYRPR